METFHQLRQSLLGEARRSPNLLSDLAGLERYVAQSYDARSVFELLQNADDAGARRFLVRRHGNMVLVANDGRPFDAADLEALCRAAASTKRRGQAIGYRGIGFKSVVAFADRVLLASGDFEVAFSRKLTARALEVDTAVPLVRIPHALTDADAPEIVAAMRTVQEDGFGTVFGFADLTGSAVDAEFSAFDPTSLLFLRHVLHIEISAEVEEMHAVRRTPGPDNSLRVRISGPDGVTRWRVHEHSEASLAFAEGEDGRVLTLAPEDALVHAYLPTQETTGLGLRIHGDVSTDPSRTRVMLDDHTLGLAHRVGQELGQTARSQFLRGEAEQDLLPALVPATDPRAWMLKRASFASRLAEGVRDAFAGDDRLRRCPSWWNHVDFATACRMMRLQPALDWVDPARGDRLLRAAEVPELTIDDALRATVHWRPSLAGAAELAARCAALSATGSFTATESVAAAQLWVTEAEGAPASLDQAALVGPLDSRFLDLLAEQSITVRGVHRLIAASSSPEVAAVLLPDVDDPSSHRTGRLAGTVGGALAPPDPPRGTGPPGSAPLRAVAVRRWRRAEEQVAEILTARGYTVDDVSRRNLGYDLEATKPDGMRVVIEVKSLAAPGASFTMTANEEAVARERGESYHLALVAQAGSRLQICLLPHPLQRLSLERQCRQWVYECGDYDFAVDIEVPLA